MPYIRGRTSELWNHFEPSGGDKAKCGYCSCQLSIVGGSLNNLKRHLLAKHPTVQIIRNPSNQQRGISISNVLNPLWKGIRKLLFTFF